MRRLLAGAATLVFAVLTLRLLFFQGPYLPATPLPAAPLVDVHCHAAGIGAGGSGCRLSDAMIHNVRFHFFLRALGVARDQLERDGDTRIIERIAERLGQSARVGHAIILAMDGVVDANGNLALDQTEFYVPNEFVAAAVARHTNLWLGASINPYRRDALERLEWAVAQRARLIKWIPPIQHIDPADPRLTSFYRRLAELKLPLLSHTGQERSFTRSRDELGDPERLKLPLSLGVTVIAAHAACPGEAGGERDIDRLRRMMGQYPNLYAEISSLTQINKLGYLREVLRSPEFKGRLLYGTDYPLINTPSVSAWYFPLNLTVSQMWRISRIENPWDRDVALKQALGVPAEVFVRSAGFFRE
jgi:predicted TIM-barrel fold metal-dependent hydrolase